MPILDKIKSIREGIGAEYVRPPLQKVDNLVNDLKNSKEALDYLHTERGLSDDTIEHFKLGYDNKRNAISIPVFKDGVLVNIKYRLLKPDNFKYTSERNAESWIFNEDGLDVARKKGNILIVEGEFDCMIAWQAGVKNIISPSTGKDSYGLWIEKLDTIPKIYLAYDNDNPGKKASVKFAERLGIEKCMEIVYSDGLKDATEYFTKHTIDEFRELWKKAKPFYMYKYKGLGEIINDLRYNKDDTISVKYLPNVKMQRDWLIVISGLTNAGKTSYVLNLADELTKQKVPTLIMPFERGIETVGKRFLQVKFDKTIEDFGTMEPKEWDEVTANCIDLPLYFAMPNKTEIEKTIIDAKRLFGVGVVIVDHLDYLIRHTNHRESEIANTLQNLKRVAEEHQIIMIIVTHVRKIASPGSQLSKKPNLDDLKGSSSLSQDPECVAMLYSEKDSGQLEVNIVKNKGSMSNNSFEFNIQTGRLSDEFNDEI